MSDTFDEDPVRLFLDGHETPLAETYEVGSGVLEVPAHFDITVGHSGLHWAVATLFPPRTPFEVRVGEKTVMVGETDGYSMTSASATMRIRGRDWLARLTKGQILSEQTFAEKTFADLVKIALKAVNLENHELVTSNTANRKAITGKEAVEFEKTTVDAETQAAGTSDGGARLVYRTIKGDVGTSWFEFITTQNRRAGLFLWSTHDGKFVLARPNGAQQPLYRIVRRQGSPKNQISVLGPSSFENDTVQRYSECRVLGRGGGGKNGRGKILGRFIDEEMVRMLNPKEEDRADGGKYREPLIIRDPHVKTPEQAKLLARRKIAECRRNAWRLTYYVPGHSVSALNGGGRVVWQPDTVVHVVDDELGLDGPMYIESVKFKRTPETHTEIHVMRIDDLVFQEEPDEVMKKRPKLQVRRGVTVVERASLQLQGVTLGGRPVHQKTVWTTDPNAAVGEAVTVSEDDKDHVSKNVHDGKVNVTSRPVRRDEVF